MPTPIGHALGGYAAAEAATPETGGRNSKWAIVLLAVVVAISPDFDFIPGLLVNNIPKYHRTMSHGVPAALVVASVLTVLLRGWWKGALWQLWVLLFAAYMSHVVLDIVTPDPTGGSGIRPLWPLSSVWFAYPLPFLEPLNQLRILDHGGTNETFWATLFSTRAAMVFVIDAVMVLPIVLAVRWAKRLTLRPYGRRTTTARSSIQ